MMTIDEFEKLLDETARELPAVFYDELNGGILLLPEVKYHPKAQNNDLYIMGEYHRDQMGRYIVIYYGSFERIYGHLDRDALKEEMLHTLKHEFRHHLESMAGMRDLEIFDRMAMDEYEKKEAKI
ncbi:MAG: metallopeptidase family protein [Eubacterium sp.]